MFLYHFPLLRMATTIAKLVVGSKVTNCSKKSKGSYTKFTRSERCVTVILRPPQDGSGKRLTLFYLFKTWYIVW